jgi:hypothetical protein
MENSPESPFYFEIHFNENDDPTFNHNPELIVESYEDFIHADLKAVRFGAFDSIPIIITYLNNTKFRWIKLKDGWHKIHTPKFYLRFDSSWEPCAHDENKNQTGSIESFSSESPLENIKTIYHVNLLEVFGSHYKWIEVNGRKKKIMLPPPHPS